MRKTLTLDVTKNNNLVSSNPICDLYSEFTLFLLKNLFGNKHTVAVGTYLQLFEEKKVINIHIITGSK